MITAAKIIPEFILSLDKEIEALKKGRGGNFVKVFNGRLVKETAGLYIYIFHLENFLIAIDDTPAELEVRGKKHNCQIVSIQGMEVQISIENNLGTIVSEGRLISNLWYLLELLKKKFEESRSNTGKFKVSDSLFSGVSSIKKDGSPEYLVAQNHSNESQIKAIQASLSQTLTIIWGPPGTGKTSTIAKAVEAHLKAGRRVLLVSHANTAVDEALESIAKQLKTSSFYKEGRLIRLGICHKKTLEDDYPLVILENITAILGESLNQEKIKLLEERDQIDQFLKSYESLFNIQNLIVKKEQEKLALESSLREASFRLANERNNLNSDEETQRKNLDKLQKATEAGALKKFFLGLDPPKIQKEINQIKIIIDNRKRTISELEQLFYNNNHILIELTNEVNKLKNQLSDFFKTHNLSFETLGTEKKKKERQRDVINSRISEIDKALDGIQKQILTDARLVATTLTKTYTSKQFPDIPFDVLIVDESSMAPLPHLYWAASKAVTYITIVGDFKQLPPICVSDDDTARKWLGRNIFDILEINSVSLALKDNRIALLDTQYRMHPSIANISN
ncbi:MAG: AAA domain-containing protein [Syntrophomonadaceae bacterium]|nr:AAA domain-containing protein [Syntrophomonadaceae bacterium]